MSKPAVLVYRGDNIEAVHYVFIAVVNSDGKLTHFWGDPNEAFMTRSSIKPFQLMPLILSGAADHYQFTQKELAIMASSHNGTDEHIEIVKSILKKAGNSAEMLKCGCILPLGMEAINAYPINNEHKDPLRHDCSGKHAGFLALARFMGDDLDDYLNPDNKSQKMIRETIAEFCECNIVREDYGIDGCSAPNYPMSLVKMAEAYRKLAAGEAVNSKLQDATVKIKEAMLGYPELISGENRLDFELASLFPQNIISKIGMESIEGIGFVEPNIGIAIKIHDGHIRALGVVCVEVFKQLGLLKSAENLSTIEKYLEAKTYNDRNVESGRIVPVFNLEKV